MNKTIAIVNTKQENLIEALKAKLAERFRGAKILVFSRISEAPADALLASFGMPSFIPGSKSRKIINVGTRMVDGDEERATQWELIRDENSSSEEILAELGACMEYTVIPQAAMSEAKVAYAEVVAEIGEIKGAAADCEDKDQKIEMLAKIPAVQAKALNILKELIS